MWALCWGKLNLGLSDLDEDPSFRPEPSGNESEIACVDPTRRLRGPLPFETPFGPSIMVAEASFCQGLPGCKTDSSVEPSLTSLEFRPGFLPGPLAGLPSQRVMDTLFRPGVQNRVLDMLVRPENQSPVLEEIRITGVECLRAEAFPRLSSPNPSSKLSSSVASLQGTPQIQQQQQGPPP